jgi:hypothetical protein
MFPATPASPACAGKCSGRIELVPSLRAATLAGAWLLAVCAATLLGVEAPLPARIAICFGIASFGWAGIRSACLLAGPDAVRAIGWRPDGQLLVWFRSSRRESAVTLAAGSFRLGCRAFVLWLESCDGNHVVVIDAGIQDFHAIRRLAGRLNRAPERARDEQQQAS